jgi:hypothetical protein
MNNRRKTEDRKPNLSHLEDLHRAGGSLHPSLRSKVEERMHDGFYDCPEILKEIAARILKFCRND